MSLTPEVDITPRQHEVSLISYPGHSPVIVDSLGLSLPSNHAFNSFLTHLSSRLANRYLVTSVVQCLPGCESTCIPCGQCLIIALVSGLDTGSSGTTMSLCIIAKPFVWYRDGGTSSTSVERLDEKVVDCVDEVHPVVAKRKLFRRLLSD